MGATIVSLKLRNTEDVIRAKRGDIEEYRVRRIEAPALVDTGSNYTGLHRAQIDYLGLTKFQDTQIVTGGGVIQTGLWGSAEMSLLGRSTHGVVLELPDKVPPIVGFFLLESLDLLVDPGSQRVFGIPDRPESYLLVSHWVLDTLPESVRPKMEPSSPGQGGPEPGTNSSA